MIGEDLTEWWHERSSKNEAAGQTRSNPCNSWDGKPASDARSIAMLPGAAARAPIKQDCDVRPRGAATKVRTPFRQTGNATLEAALAILANNLWRDTRQ
jgi:hypothetical protein